MPISNHDLDKDNERALKDLGDGESTTFVQGGEFVAIGSRHPRDVIAELRHASQHAEGTIQIKKGGVFGAGSLAVHGCRDRPHFKTAIDRISKKKVIFE